MAGSEGPGGVGPTLPFTVSDGTGSVEPARGKHKGVPVEPVEVKKKIRSKSSRRSFRRLADFKSISRLSSARKQLSKPKPETTVQSEPAPVPAKKKPEASVEDHKAVLQSRLVDKAATDIQIKNARKQQPWKDLEKIANPTKKKKISDKGFARLKNELLHRDTSHNREHKLMVMFAAHKFERGELSPDQMQEYVGILSGKYIMARAKEQANASALTLALSGSERTGFGGEKPLKASETVQLAELIVTTEDRLNNTDATDEGSGVVHNYKRDFPLDLYGWSQIDFEEMSRSVDKVLVQQFPGKLIQAAARESGSTGLNPQITEQFKTTLVEGVERSLDEYTDSLLRAAESRVSNPIYKDVSVKESEQKIKEKVAKRRDQLVSTLEKQFGEAVVDKAKVLPTDRMVGNKIDLWVKTKETTSEEKTGVPELPESQPVEPLKPEETIHRGSMLDDLSRELAEKAKGRVRALKEGKDPDILYAAAELLKKTPPVPPKPERTAPPSPEPEKTVASETGEPARTRASGEVDRSSQAKVKDSIRKFERINEEEKKRTRK